MSISKKLLCLVFCGSMLFVPGNVLAENSGIPTTEAHYTHAVDTSTSLSGYPEYYRANSGTALGTDTIAIDVEQPADLTSGEIQIIEGKKAIYLPEGSSATYTVSVPEDCLYEVHFLYRMASGQEREGELSFTINTEKPFAYNNVVLQRIYKDNPIKQDNRGNDIRPLRSEVALWSKAALKDIHSYSDKNFLIRFRKGQNTITFRSEWEGFYLAEMALVNPSKPIAYEQYRKQYEDMNTAKAGDIKVQAENTFLKSNAGIALQADRSNPGVENNSPSQVKLNKLGGSTWKKSGQWVSWKVKVKQAGWYTLSFRYRQNIIRGLDTKRRIYIDDKVLFAEAATVRFPYTNDWATMTLGGNTPYAIYLTPGEHVIKAEVVLGEIGNFLSEINDCVLEMSALYRKIVMVTGRIPDPYRDYNLDTEIPDLIDRWRVVRERLVNQAKAIDSLSPFLGNESAFIYEVVRQLDDFIKEPQTIQRRLNNYEGNISSLASLALRLKNQPLELDYLQLTTSDVAIARKSTHVMDILWFRLKSFISSFFNDYSAIGNVYDDEQKPINVWVSANDITTTSISSGRDQAQILKILIDEGFTGTYDIPVNLSLVNTYDTMMQAVMSGNGPDAAVLIPESMVINLSTRQVLENLSDYPGYDIIRSSVTPSSLIAYKYNNGSFAIPETQVFHMLFYRKDIFSEMQLTPPQTWDEFFDVANKLQKKNMQVGIPENVSVFEMLLLQHGGNVYNQKLSAVTLTEKKAITAFQMWTDLYVKYGLPLQFDFVTMFRTGEMPLGIIPLTAYNQLSVAAPEINNLWEMLPVPGIKEANGRINRSQSCTGTGAILFTASKHKQQAYTFLQWWTSKDTQTRFGLEIESLIGAASRYNTANREAFSHMAWSKQEFTALEQAIADVSDIYQTPAMYYINRNLTNAFRAVVFRYENPLEVMNKYSREMDKELKRKRKEFRLDE